MRAGGRLRGVVTESPVALERLVYGPTRPIPANLGSEVLDMWAGRGGWEPRAGQVAGTGILAQAGVGLALSTADVGTEETGYDNNSSFT